METEIVRHVGNGRVLTGTRMLKDGNLYRLPKSEAHKLFNKYPNRFKFATAEELKKVAPDSIIDMIVAPTASSRDRETPAAVVAAPTIEKKKLGRPPKAKAPFTEPVVTSEAEDDGTDEAVAL